MAIYKRTTVDPYLKMLEEYQAELMKAVQGSTPSANSAEFYGVSPSVFQLEYTDIDLRALNTAIKHFKIEVDELNQLKKKDLQEKRMAR